MSVQVLQTVEPVRDANSAGLRRRALFLSLEFPFAGLEVVVNAISGASEQ